MVTKWSTGREHLQCGDSIQRDNSCLRWDTLGGHEISCFSECCAIQTYELVISGIFHVIFSDCRPQTTKTSDRWTMDVEGGNCTRHFWKLVISVI